MSNKSLSQRDTDDFGTACIRRLSSRSKPPVLWDCTRRFSCSWFPLEPETLFSKLDSLVFKSTEVACCTVTLGWTCGWLTVLVLGWMCLLTAVMLSMSEYWSSVIWTKLTSSTFTSTFNWATVLTGLRAQAVLCRCEGGSSSRRAAMAWLLPDPPGPRKSTLPFRIITVPSTIAMSKFCWVFSLTALEEKQAIQ